jgi:hypothetical protein
MISMLDDTDYSHHDFDETTAMYGPQCMGMVPELKFGSLFRPVSATAKPGLLKLQTPAANKLSIYSGIASTATWTEYPDTSSGFDFLRMVADRRSVISRDIWALINIGSIDFAAPIFDGEGSWDSECTWNLALLASGHVPKTRALAPVLEDKSVPIPMRDVGYIQIKYGTESPTECNDPLEREAVDDFMDEMLALLLQKR